MRIYSRNFWNCWRKKRRFISVSSGPEEELTADQITADMKGKILIGGSFLSLEAYKKL